MRNSSAMPFPVTEGILPWSRSCFVCGQENPHGLHLKSRVEGDRVVLDYTTREADLGWRHIVHGGILMTLMDEVMTWAAMLAAGEAVVAAEVTAGLKKPVSVGTVLRVEGSVTTVRRKLVLTAARVMNPDGEVMARASGKYLPMPRVDFALCRDDFVADPGALPLSRILPRMA